MEKNLVIFTNSFPFGNGEVFLSTEVDFLAMTFSKIHFFPLYYGNQRNARKLPENVTYSDPVIGFDIKKNKIKLFLTGICNCSPIRFSLLEFFEEKVYKNGKRMRNWLGTSLMIRILLKEKYFGKIRERVGQNTIFYFYWGDKSSGIVPFLREITANPIIARFHNSDLYEEIKGGYIPYRKDLLKNLTYSVFISEKGSIYLKNRYPEINFKSCIFRLGVKEGKWMSGSDDGIFRLISCSYVVPVKRVQLILDSIQFLPFKLNWTHFGDGPLLAEIREKTKGVNDNIKVFFPGFVDNSEIQKFYFTNKVDLFINLSKSEGIPVSIMEAVSFGIPVLATDVGGTAEIVTDEVGYLLPEHADVKEISRRISDFYYLSTREKNEKRIAAFRQWKDMFNASENYSRFAGFLNGLI